MSQENQQFPGDLLDQSAAEMSDMVLAVRADGKLYYASASVENVLGYSDRDFLRLYNHTLEFSDDQRFSVVRQFILRQLQKLRAEMLTGFACEPENLAVNHRDGFRVTLSVQCIPSNDSQGELQGAVCVCRDISNRRHPVDLAALNAAVFENRLVGIYVADLQGRITRVNSTFCRITGYREAEVIGRPVRLIGVERYSAEFFQKVCTALEDEDFWEGEIQHRDKRGQVFSAWVELRALRDGSGRLVSTVGFLTDLAESHSASERSQRQAYFDSLTRLPNKTLFLDRWNQVIVAAQRHRTVASLIVLDLCGFRKINDHNGHQFGDELIEQVGRRLQDTLRAADSIARLGSDRFAITLSQQADIEEAQRTTPLAAERLCQVLRQPFIVQGESILCTADLGISCYPTDGSEPLTLLKRAEQALLQVRSSGCGGYRFYCEAMQRRAEQNRKRERQLFAAFKRGQLEVHYQPVLNVASGQVESCEALLRWRHPEGGLLAAGDFISLAEATGLIEPLGNWVLRQAAAQWSQWQQNRCGVARVSVNISASQLRHQVLFNTLHDLLMEGQIAAAALQLELSEVVLSEDDQLIDHLDAIRRLGVSILVDAFDASRLSLQQLNGLPVDGIKTHARLLEEIESSEERRLLEAIIAMARHLDLEVVVCGVETEAQLRYVRRSGCQQIQGFLISEPVLSVPEGIAV